LGEPAVEVEVGVGKGDTEKGEGEDGKVTYPCRGLELWW
jgi:hypothetical protein